MLSVRAALVCSLVAACTAEEGAIDEAPKFALQDLDEDWHALHEHRGEVVLLSFWATWCPPCLEELPHFAELARTHGPIGFTVFAINTDSPRLKAKVARIAAASAWPFEVLLDHQGAAQRAYSVDGFPTNILIDRTGRIIFRREGLIRAGDGEFSTILSDALAAPVPP